MEHNRRTIICDRCKKPHDLAEIVEKQLTPDQNLAPEDLEKLQAKAGEQFKARLDLNVLGVIVRYMDLCPTCQSRIKNLALEMAKRYEEVRPVGTRRKKGSEAPKA